MQISSLLKRGVAVAVLGLAAASLAGCGSAASGGGATSASPTTLTLGINITTTSWKPAMLYSGLDASMWWGAVYDTFLHCTPAGVPGPGAAESFTLSPDNRVLTMTMRKGMKFQDGTPVDAVAAKSSIEEMRDGGGSFSGQLAGLTVKILDDRTVEVTSPGPRRTIASTFCLGAGIVSSPAALASPTVDTKPISSGPYVLDAAQSTSGSIWTFHKRTDYWDAASYPYKTIVMRQMPDVTARLNALKTGQINSAALDYTTAPEAEKSGLSVFRTIGYYAGLHLADRDGKVVPALGDLRVRQAINMVFDRESILKNIFHGEGAVTEQIMHPDSAGYVKALNSYYPYDVSKAKRLMAQAGYANGFDIELPSYPPLTASVNPMIIQQLGELNIRVKEVPLQSTTFISDLLSGRFPMFYFQMGTTPDPKFSVDYGFKIWNSLGATDSRLTPMLDATETLRGTRADANFRSINEFWVKQAWFAPFVYQYEYLGLSSKNLIPKNTGPLGYPQLSDFK